MSNLKVYTKLIIGFVTVEVFAVLALLTGFSAASNVIKAPDPEGYIRHYRIFTGIVLVVMLVIMTGIVFSVLRTIRTSLKQLSDVALHIAEGRVDITLEKKSNDEFGELIDEYQQVVDNIRYQARVAEEVAEGNMTVDVHPKSEGDVLGKALKKLVNRNNHALSNINDAACQVTTSASQVASASETLAQGSTEQASAIEQITVSIDDIAAKTKQNAEDANKAAELIAEAIEDVKKGNEQMRDMVVAMGEINKSSEDISKIIKVIDDIAFQTNILALNAAVEAARAGEAGKGFAVVAEEVRNLAAKSAAAAAETAEMIEDSIQKVEVGSNYADETAKALETITDIVKQSETIIDGIAEASNYQATAIAQIDQAIEQVSQVVQNNSATSEECAAASVELASQASRMRDLLSVYKLGHHGMGSMDNNFGEIEDKNERIISLNDGFGKY